MLTRRDLFRVLPAGLLLPLVAKLPAASPSRMCRVCEDSIQRPAFEHELHCPKLLQFFGGLPEWGVGQPGALQRHPDGRWFVWQMPTWRQAYCNCGWEWDARGHYWRHATTCDLYGPKV